MKHCLTKKKRGEGYRENQRGQAHPGTTKPFDQHPPLLSTKTLFPKDMRNSNDPMRPWWRHSLFWRGKWAYPAGRNGLVSLLLPERSHQMTTWTTCLSAMETKSHIREPHPEDNHFWEIRNTLKQVRTWPLSYPLPSGPSPGCAFISVFSYSSKWKCALKVFYGYWWIC